MFRDYIDSKISEKIPSVEIEPVTMGLLTAIISAVGGLGAGALNLFAKTKELKALKEIQKQQIQQTQIISEAEKIKAEAEARKARMLAQALTTGAIVLGGSMVLVSLVKVLGRR
jgi:predicted histidine transporter YuiF (NhaC family)